MLFQYNFIAVTCGVNATLANERKQLIHDITSNGWREDRIIWHCTSQCASAIHEATNGRWKNSTAGKNLNPNSSLLPTSTYQWLGTSLLNSLACKFLAVHVLIKDMEWNITRVWLLQYHYCGCCWCLFISVNLISSFLNSIILSHQVCKFNHS